MVTTLRTVNSFSRGVASVTLIVATPLVFLGGQNERVECARITKITHFNAFRNVPQAILLWMALG